MPKRDYRMRDFPCASGAQGRKSAGGELVPVEGAGTGSIPARRMTEHERRSFAQAAFAAAALGGAGALAGMGANTAYAVEGSPALTSGQYATHAPAPAAAISSQAQVQTAHIKVPHVQGVFTYTQDVVTPVWRMVHDLGATSGVLCESNTGLSPDEAWDTRRARTLHTAGDPLDIPLQVRGLVARELDTSARQLGRDARTTRLMAYTCADNPADGRATANAEVSGIDLNRILDAAGVAARANVITFTSHDNYSVRLPLDYVLSHGAVVVDTINGHPVSEVVGSANQLWIAATAARYNVRDLRLIELEHASGERMPATPGTAQANDGYQNRPNVGSLSGFSVLRGTDDWHDRRPGG